MMSSYKDLVQNLLNYADIQLDGNRPWDIKIHNNLFYKRVINGGSLAFGESYMEGWWDCEKIDELVTRILRTKLHNRISFNLRNLITLIGSYISYKIPSDPFEIGKHHYDLGNDFFEAMLGKTMVYSCGYWKDAKDLDEAQEAKLDLVCRKIGLKSGQRILDIGCGWGSFARYAAKKYGAAVVGITVSQEQAAYAKEWNTGLPVEIRYQDYRTLDETFDHIVSIGMFEHVGPKNYSSFMKIACKCLNDNGLFLLHTIGGNHTARHNDPWIEKYIFPHSVIPSMKQIAKAVENRFVIEDWHNFGLYYDKTLLTWHENFERAWPALKKKYDTYFYRMWKFYLLACAGTFRARKNNLWQIVLSKNGLPWSYVSIR